MISKIIVTNHASETMEVDVADTVSSGLIIKSISGVNPVNADINTSNMATGDGVIFNSARMGSRNVVLDFYYDTTQYPVETTRQKLYQYFPIKKQVTLEFVSENRDLTCTGYVESIETEMYDSDGNTNISISVICPDPFMYEKYDQFSDFSGIAPNFEFPFDITEEGIEISTVRLIKEKLIYYTGRDDVGVTIKLHMIGEVSGLAIYNATLGQKMSFSDTIINSITGNTLIYGDDIVVETRRGKKSVTLIRDGVSYSIINAVGKDADWFTLSKGDNIYYYTADVGEYNVQIVLINKIAYEGI